MLYPGVFDCSIGSRVKEFYSLFFHYALTDAELDKLMVYAVPNSSPTPAATQASVPAAGICAVQTSRSHWWVSTAGAPNVNFFSLFF